MDVRNDIRNIAIIAHVDHGKTTLVDAMLRQSGTFRDNQHVAERVMDSGDLERERGITILSKNTAIHWKGTKINIVDTPGHADFSGEVERVLMMVDGVLLLVDAFEGPMPQTRFVLDKALALNLPVLVVLNKVDRPDARPDEVISEVLDLFIALDAPASQLDRPFLYVSARQGTSSLDPDALGDSLTPLLDAILTHIPAPVGEIDGPAQVLISTIDYSEYVGRIGIGRIERGTLNEGMQAVRCTFGAGQAPPTRLSGLYTFDGLKRIEATSVSMGDIVAVSGIEALFIGDTICAPEAIEPLPFLTISEPTVRMTFSVNDSPFAGREGQYVTSRHLRARLYRELETDVSLRVSEADTADAFQVCGRGELHLSILIETMRRQGYELSVSRPEVLLKEIDGIVCEPMERVVCDVPQASAGAVMEKLGGRRGILMSMQGTERVRLTFIVPARGLFGYRSEFLTDTRGEGIMSAVFEEYQPMKGDMPGRAGGSLVAFETGDATSYGLFNAQERGTLYVTPSTPVYTGMVVGANPRVGDIEVNVCKKKHVTNTRNAASAEDSLRLTSVKPFTLEECLEALCDDEILEVTPKALRMRKRVLDRNLRQRMASRKKD